MNYSRLDVAMARSATIRFRIYAWRYAAELWEQDWLTATAGNGAGQYPRLAGQLSLRDRSLDPTAFMGDIVEHAHNELFEVLTEIGLVGGVTFVAGFLATLVAGVLLARRRATDPHRWLHIGLVAGLAALMVDACFSPGLRLAGVPALFYTVVGLLWAACRGAVGVDTGAATRISARRRAAAVLVLVLAVAGGWLTIRDWRGVVREEAAHYAFRQGDFAAALRGREFAGEHVLDPVRQLINDGSAMQAHVALAHSAHAEYLSARQAGVASQPAKAVELRRVAIARSEAAFASAVALSHRAPTLMGTAGAAASVAELLAQLIVDADEEVAEEWARRANQAWRRQRTWRPYDFETLLALTNYRAPLPYHIGLLRDALRATYGYNRLGQRLSFNRMRGRWHNAMRKISAEPGFAELLRQFVAVVGPIDPQTDLDTLIASRAPEVYRVAAHFEALRGDFDAARANVERAIALYGPMRERFPTHLSHALFEQAEFILRGTPDEADAAAEVLRQALDRLPVIQEQKYDVLARPYRRRLAVALLAANDERGAG